MDVTLPSNTGELFDATPYEVGVSRQTRPTKPAPTVTPTVAPSVLVAVDDIWRVRVGKQYGVVHAKALPLDYGGWQTYCGKVGAVLTLDVGATASGCPACADAGAAWTAAA